MDSRGWIPIPVMASFRRVQQLTSDEHLVKAVLSLSSLVEVRGDWVRAQLWERYILPDAPESIVEPGPKANRGSDVGTSSEGDPSSSATSHDSPASQDVNSAAEYSSQEGQLYATYGAYQEGDYSQVPHSFYAPGGEFMGSYTVHSGAYVHAHRPGEAPEHAGQLDRQNGYEHEKLADAPDIGAEKSMLADLSGDSDEFEDSDSDVEFVLGKDANRSWTPERKQG